MISNKLQQQKNIKQGCKDDEISNTDGLDFYIYPQYENVATRKTTRVVKSEKDVSSKGNNCKGQNPI